MPGRGPSWSLNSGDIDKDKSSWQVNLIRLIWEQWHTLWKQRNSEVHGHDERTRVEATKRDVKRQLTDLPALLLIRHKSTEAATKRCCGS